MKGELPSSQAHSDALNLPSAGLALLSWSISVSGLAHYILLVQNGQCVRRHANATIESNRNSNSGEFRSILNSSVVSHAKIYTRENIWTGEYNGHNNYTLIETLGGFRIPI